MKNFLLSTWLALVCFCHSLGVHAQCSAPGACDPTCPSICVTDATLEGVAAGLCLGGTSTLLCLDWNGQGDPSTIAIDYTLNPSLGETIALVPNGAGNQVCIEVTTPPASGCEITETTLAINAITPSGGCTLGYDLQLSSPIAINETGCDINTGQISPFPIINLDLLPTLNSQLPPLVVYPSYEVVVIEPACDDSTTGSAVVQVNGADCFGPITGIAGSQGECPNPTPSDGTLSYDFAAQEIGTAADGTVYTLTEAQEAGCLSGTLADDITEPCDAIACATCPNYVATVAAPEICENADVEICVEFDGAADDITVNGESVAAAGDTQICYTVVSVNGTCLPIEEMNTPEIVCTLDDTVIFQPSNAVWTTYPLLIEEIVPPTCEGEAGFASLISFGGEACENIAGTAGVANECPATEDTDATLVYDFTGYNDPLGCFVGTAGIEPIDCTIACACPQLADITTNSPICIADGVPIEVCVSFIPNADGMLVNGIAALAPGDTQICYEVEPINAGCDIVVQDVTPQIICTIDGSSIDIFAPVLVDVFPDPSLFTQYELIAPDVECGAAPSIDISNSTCPPIIDELIEPAVNQTDCDIPGVDGSYSFTILPDYPEGSECLPPFDPIVEFGVIPACTLEGCCICPDIFDPVCGEDGITYSNSCEAECAGVAYVPGACESVCPGYIVGPASPVCGEGELSEVCLTFDGPADSYSVFTNNDVYTVVNPGDTEICVEIFSFFTNDDCEPFEFDEFLFIECANGEFFEEFILLEIYPEPFTVEIIEPQCDGEAGSAILLSASGIPCAPPVEGVAGISGECPGPGEPATLSYDFGTFFEGTSCPQGPFAAEIVNDCFPTGCGEICSDYTVGTPSPICGEGTAEICIDFDGPADSYTIITNAGSFDLPLSGNATICAEVLIADANQTCDPVLIEAELQLACSDFIIIELVPIELYPEPFTVEVIASECDGAAGSATLLNSLGEPCGEPIEGTPGVSGECPGPGEPAILFYEFGPFFEGTDCEQGPFSDFIFTDCFPTDCGFDCPPYVLGPIAPVCGEGELVEVCLAFEGPADDYTIFTNIDAYTVVNPGDTEICVEIASFFFNDSCEPFEIDEFIFIECANGQFFEEFILLEIYPEPFTVEIIQPQCDGEAGSAVLLSASGIECAPPVEGVAGISGECPGPGEPATLSYDFGTFFEGTACPQGPFADDIVNNCFPIGCGEFCSNYTLGTPTPLCGEGISEICIDFDGPADSYTVFTNAGVYTSVLPGNATICAEIIIADANQGCDPVLIDAFVDLACTDFIVPETVQVELYPEPFTVEVITPECDGAAGSATLLNSLGEPCGESIEGTPGVSGECPGPGEPAILEYNFGPFFEGTDCEQGPFSDFIFSDCFPTDCGFNCPDYIVGPASPVCGEGELSEVCLTFDGPADGYFIFTNAGDYSVVNPGDEEICVEIFSFEINESCEPIIIEEFIDIFCENGFGSFEIIELEIYPEPFTVDVTQPQCDGEAGSAVLLSAFGEPCAEPIEGIAGITGECPGPGEPATLSYDFGIFFEGTACQQGPFADDIIVECNPSGCNGECDAVAPLVEVTGGECIDGVAEPFVFTEDGTGNSTPPFFTEFIVTDGASGNIVGVYATIAEADAEANALGTACVQAINHEGLEDLVNDLDGQTGGLLCGSGIIACPVTDLSSLFGLLGGLGTPVDVATVVALIGAPGAGNPGVDLGAVLGIPIPLVVDVPPFCYALGEEVCIEPVDCNNPSCTIDDITVGEPVCSEDGSYTITVTVTGSDASVTLDDGNGPVPAVTTTFSFAAGTSYFIEVLDTDLGPVDDPLCAFGPFEGAAPDCSEPTGCEAQAPVVSVDEGDCAADGSDADGSGDGTPFNFSEDGTSNTNVPFFTEFVVTDIAGNIIGVFTSLTDAQDAANAETIANGQACISAINHEGLEDLVNTLDAAAFGFLCPIIGCPVNDLATLYTAIAGVGGPLTINDVIALVGPPGVGNPGFNLGDLIDAIPIPITVDIPPFCYDLSDEVCITNTECGEEPIITIACDEVPEIALLEDFCICEDPKIDTATLLTQAVPPNVIEFFITDPQFGNVIVDIDSLGIYDASDLAVGESICVTPIIYDQSDIDDFINDINGLIDLAGTFGITLPIPTIPTGTSFGDVFDLIEPILFGGGVVDVAGFDAAISAVNGTVIDIGELLGLPIPGLLTIEFDICYTIGEEQCATVVEDIPIEITCPEEFNYECSELPFTLEPVGTNGFATATGGCGELTITHEDVQGEAVCPVLSVIERTWTATDACGNTETCVQLINAVDTQGPVIDDTGIEDLVLTCSDIVEVAELTATDFCDPDIIVTVDIAITEASVCAGNSGTITYTAVDACGNEAEPVIQNVTILPDENAPTFDSEPSAITDIACGEALPVQETLTATDDCTFATVVAEEIVAPGLPCSGYPVIHRWTATDDCGNAEVVEITFNVLPDSEAPVFVEALPEDIVLTCTDELQSAIGLTAIDNCNDAEVSFTEVDDMAVCPSDRIITRTWIAADACGNEIEHIQTVTILADTEAPIFEIPANVDLTCGESEAVITVFASDNCDLDIEVPMTEDITGNDCIGYTITRTYGPVADACGNEAPAQIQTITIEACESAEDVNESATLCEGEVYTSPTNGMDYTASATETLTDGSGCEYTLSITIDFYEPTADVNESATLCEGEVYTSPTNGMDYTASANEILTDDNGCEYALNITIEYYEVTPDVSESATLCEGEVYTSPTNGMDYTASTTETLTDDNGCEYALNITIEYYEVTPDVSESATLCEGEIYTSPTNGMDYTASANEILTDDNGCEYALNITIEYYEVTPDVSESATLCEGEVYTSPTNGMDYTASTTETLTDENGCEYALSITIDFYEPTADVNESATLCEGEVYTSPTNGMDYTASANEILTDDNGCEYALLIDLTVEPCTSDDSGTDETGTDETGTETGTDTTGTDTTGTDTTGTDTTGTDTTGTDTTGTDTTGTDTTGTDTTGADTTGTDTTGTDTTGTDTTGTDTTGTDTTGTDTTGADTTGTDTTGADTTGTDTTGADTTGTDTTGTDTTGTDTTGTDTTGTDTTGTDTTGTDTTGTDMTGTDTTGTDTTGTDTTGTDTTGTDTTGTDMTGTDTTGTDTTGTDETGTDETGTDDGGSDTLGSISDNVWYDEDGDGTRNGSEGGISGVEIILVYPDGSIEVTYTDINGDYLFDDLPAGDYQIVVGNVPGFFNTTPNIINYTLSDGEDYVDGDFGFDLMEEPFDCAAFVVDHSIECLDGDVTFEISFALDGFDPADGYTVNGVVQNSTTYQEGPFNAVDGYYYEIAPVADPTCVTVISAEEVSCTVTAIELIAFEGETLEDANLLHWITVTEIDNDFFTIQRSEDGINFENIGVVNGVGNSSIVNSYSFKDTDLRSDNYFYRLLDTDINGETNIASEIIELRRNNNFDISVYPIPANDVLNINIDTDAMISITIIDVSGKLVKTEQNVNNVIDISDLTSGNYFLIVSDSESIKTVKFIKH